MLALALAAIVVVACSAIVGQGVCVIAGRPQWNWWAPGVGFALLLTVGGVLIRLPGHSKGVALGIALLTFGSLALPATRAALLTALPDGLAITALTLLPSLIPFLVMGRAGLLGEGMNNDSGAHLATAWWLQHKHGPMPVGALGGPLAAVGYPLGPHGLIDGLSVGHISLAHAFTGMVIAVAPLTGMVAMGAFSTAPRPLRWIAGALVGLCYLGASFQVQASFKETMLALLVVTVTLATRDIVRDYRPGTQWLAGIPIGVAIAGSVYAYSYGGLPWTVAAAVAVAIVTAGGSVRRIIPILPGALLAGAIVLEPELDQIARFAQSPFNHEVGDGNLKHALSAFEVLGVWFNYDFRWTPSPLTPTIAFLVVAVLAAGIALVRLIRAHELALPAALIPTLAIYAYANAEKSIYLSAKALTIAAPLVATTIAAGLLMPMRAPSPRARRAPSPRVRRLAIGAVGTVFALAAAWSTFLVLRDARVGPLVHRSELASFQAKIGGEPVLFMPKEDMLQWDLVGANAYSPRRFYAPLSVLGGPHKPMAVTGFFDFDNFTAETLNRFRYAITTNSPYQSTAPRNWHRVDSTRSFILWRRSGRSSERYSLDFPGTTGRVLDCNSELGKLRLYMAGNGFAVVLPRPVTGLPNAWHGETTNAGDTASMTLQVPRGRWDLSLAYASNVGLVVRAGTLHRHMPQTIDRVGAYYKVGTLTQPHTGPLTIHLRANQLNWFGRLLGAHGHTRGLDTPSNVPLGGVALTRHGAKPRRVQPRKACGRYTDHVVARDTSRSTPAS